MSERILSISSGTGPWEVRRFVSLLAHALADEIAGFGIPILSRAHRGDAEAPISAALLLKCCSPPLLDLVGTHVLHARSPKRPRASRQRWHAGVLVQEPYKLEVPDIDPRDVEFRATRAGGPGGQNVNARSTAIRALHRPSGLRVRVTTERSQGANRRLALERLAKMVAAENERKEGADDKLRRGEHFSWERGNPQGHWELDRKGQLQRCRRDDA